MKKIFLAVIILCACVSAVAQEADYEYRTFTSADGKTLNYRLLTPDEEAKGKKFPLVVFLHGAGQKGDDNEKQLINGGEMFLNPVNREKYPAFVIFPQCPEGEWWTWDRKPKNFDTLTYSEELNPSLRMVKEVIDEHLALSEVDKSRIYLIGYSMGAVGIYDLVAHYPDMFAAAVPMAGAIAPGHLEKARKTAFRIFHGDIDPTVPVKCSRRVYKELRKAGIKVEYIEMPGGKHSICKEAYGRDDFMSWIFKQKR